MMLIDGWSLPLLFGEVFSAYDAWNSHAYPDNIFGMCNASITGSCKPFHQQHGMIGYREELQLFGLPSDFPVFLTEASVFDST